MVFKHIFIHILAFSDAVSGLTIEERVVKLEAENLRLKQDTLRFHEALLNGC